MPFSTYENDDVANKQIKDKNLVLFSDYLMKKYNTYNMPQELKGKPAYTRSGWADIKGLFPCKVLGCSDIKYGKELSLILNTRDRGNPGIYKWLGHNQVYINVKEFESYKVK